MTERASTTTGIRLVHNEAATGAEVREAPAPDILDQAGADRAWAEITSWPDYRRTPLHRLQGLARRFGVAQLWYKDESERFGLSSFKALGGAYGVFRQLARIIAPQESARGISSRALIAGDFVDAVKTVTVCCATDGNHGRSVAWGSQLFGCDCVIFLPKAVSAGRKRAIEAYGAKVVQLQGNYDEAVLHAQEEAQRNGWFVISDTSYEGYLDTPIDVMQGYTVMAREAFAELNNASPPSHIFIQGGVGGLAAAVCTQSWHLYATARPRLIVVEPENADCIRRSVEAGRRVLVEGELETVMAGLSAGEVSLLAWEILKQGVDDAMTVRDEMARDAMRILARGADDDPPIVAGESAVAGLAALMTIQDDTPLRHGLGLTTDSAVLLFGTEGATDPAIYREIVGSMPESVGQRTAS